MNRILFRPSEADTDGRVYLSDRRAVHLLKVLRVEPGQTVRVGLVDGPTGSAVVEEAAGRRVTLRCFWDAAPPHPRVDLLLALPRPKVMKRLWAPLACMGVDRIVLVNAAKVERDYFDTHWLDRAVFEPLLIEGLEQSGDTRLPEVVIRKRFKPFVEDELDAMFPSEELRLLAHPSAASAVTDLCSRAFERVLLAVGPEGGWTDFELELLERHGFRGVTMGWRRLRSDVACIALLALAHAALDGNRGQPIPARAPAH